MWTIFIELATGALSVCAINDPFIKEHNTLEHQQMSKFFQTAKEAQLFINSVRSEDRT